MNLDYSKLSFDADGIPEVPSLVLQTLSRETIGVIPGISNLTFNIKFSEPSEISFDVPAIVDGLQNWVYNKLTGYKVVYTEHYGIYIIMNPEKDSDGISDIKHIKGYSLEKGLETKRFFLEEGTFKFYNTVDPYDTDTIVGRMLEVANGWSVEYVSPSVAQKYRTFSQFDDYLLSFIYNTLPEKYRCVFVFDPYSKSISIYDVDEERSTLPIYLDFDNLLDSAKVEELSDELVTAIRPYGADELDIREVNPIGTNWIYDLSHFISNGDISSELAEKYKSWQYSVQNNRSYFEGLSALRASCTAKLLAAQSAKIDLDGELEILISQQSITIQALANETTSAGKETQQQVLDDINQKISSKEDEIEQQDAVIAGIEDELSEDNDSSCVSEINRIVEELKISNFFTDAEYAVLANYMIEQDISEETFVASDIDESVSGNSYTLSNEKIVLSDADIEMIDLTSTFDKTMYSVAGGVFELSGDIDIVGDIIRGTLEVSKSNSYVLSLYAGSIKIGDTTASSGMITISGLLSSISDDISKEDNDGLISYVGSLVQFIAQSGDMYLTSNISDYKRYAVKSELYEYAVGVLSDTSIPTYEFSVDSGNFIFAKEFAPFRNRLELGRSIYLNINGEQTITPNIIEFELDFEERDKFSIVFSNRFKRYDAVSTLSDMVESSYSTSRSFDASQYIYNQATSQASQVSKFMQGSLDAAVNTIIAASNQSVVINGSGIQIGGDSQYQIRIVDSMIAMSDDNWATSKLAIGLFASEDTGSYFGVNADVIGGKLIIGNNLVIENATDTGVMQFKVDSSGAWLNNSTFIVQGDNSGRMIIDPKYGLAAGTNALYTTSGTTVTPSFIDSDGDIIFDDDGMPENTNFYLDISDGSAYFRGNLLATSGEIGGFTIQEDYLCAGSGSNFVALNGSGSNADSLYAMWAGGTSPSTAKFWVKKDGSISAKDGDFSGTLSAARLSGNLTADDDDSWLKGCGIDVNNGAFYVDPSGNVTMKGNINMSDGNITWGSSNSPVRVLYARNYIASPTLTYTGYPSSSSTGWHKTMSVAYDYYASHSYDGGQTWTDAIRIQGIDGEDGSDGYDGSDATVNERNVFNVLTDGGTKFGIFNSSTSNTLYINANYIKTGTIDAEIVTLGSKWGGFSCAVGNDGVSDTYGAKMYGSNDDYYFIATNKGVRMQSSNGNGVTVTNSGVYATEEITVGSDRRIKNNISYEMDKYSDFFMKLKPSYYRLNHGHSGRYHIGFIAQDVERAVACSGMTNEDFAGLTQSYGSDDVHSDYDDQYYLRYNNFIPLNTYMIQKLYQRIAALEDKLDTLYKE